MIYGGMDGCKSGWLLVYYAENQYQYKVLTNITDIVTLNLPKSRILVDIPIGLTSKNFTRTIESSMRAILGNRSSTVFNAPARTATKTNDKTEARKRNIALTGKSLSEQSLNIMPKIRDVDEFLNTEDYKQSPIALYESHPEICFKYLAGSILQTKKSKPEGCAERLALLMRYDKNVKKIYDSICTAELRKHVKKDDILDAICLCVVNRQAGNAKLRILRDSNDKDENNIAVGIAYYEGKL